MENNCIGRPLPPGSTCGLDIIFTPQRPAGTRSATFRVTAGPLSVETTLGGIPVRYGAGETCTLGDDDRFCAPGLFCLPWYLDQDDDGWGGEERFDGAPSKTTCSSYPDVGRPPTETFTTVEGFLLSMPYVELSGDCCDYPGVFGTSDIAVTPAGVNPGVTQRNVNPAPRCENPDDLNCDGVVDCVSVPARDGDSCI